MRRVLVQTAAVLLTFLVLGLGLVSAQGSLPSYVATPSAQAQQGTLCTSLAVVSSGRFVPSVTRFTFGLSGEVSGFRFEYGDGVVREFATAEDILPYTYLQPGTYNPQLWVKDMRGEWQTSEGCRTELAVDPTPLVTRDTECRGLDVNDQPIGFGGSVETNKSVKFTVIGRDNKEPIGQYRVNFGDGIVEEQSSNIFNHTYTADGNYTVQADVRAAGAEEYADDIGWCTRELVVGLGVTPTPSLGATPTPSGTVSDIEEQPQTGSETWILLVSIGLLGIGVVTSIVAKRVHG